jgi:hypothetical protein
LDAFKKEIESMGRKALPLQLGDRTDDADGRRHHHRIDPCASCTKTMRGRKYDNPQTPDYSPS